MDVVGYNKRYKSTTLRLIKEKRELELLYDGKDILLYIDGKFDSVVSNLKYGPYANIDAALLETSGKRTQGMVVGILEGGSLVEYWFKNGIEDSDLEVKAGGSEVIPVEDLDLYDPYKDGGYAYGEIISYKNALSLNSYFHTLRAYTANKDVPEGVSPEDSLYDEGTNPNGYWKVIDEEITIPVYQTSVVVRGSYVQIKNIVSPRHDDSVIDGNTGFAYTYNAYSTTAESVPYVLRPNNVLSTSPGRWILSYKFIVDKKFQYVVPEIPQGGGVTNIDVQLTSSFSTRGYYYIQDDYDEIDSITLKIGADSVANDAPSAKFSNKEFVIIDSNGCNRDLNVIIDNTSSYEVHWVNSLQPTTLAIGDIAYVEYTRLRDTLAESYVMLIEWKLLDKQMSGGSILTDDELAAVQNSNTPSALNPFATINDLGGGGDVVGPSSSVNERIVVFDGTTGKLIKDGGKKITDLPIYSNGVSQIPSLTNNGDGSVTLGDGSYNLSPTTAGDTFITKYTIAGSTFSLTDNTANYLVANYNGGSPIIQKTTDVNIINETTIVPIYSIYRTGNILHIQNWDAPGNSLANKIHQSIVKTQRYRRESGLSLSEYGTRNLNLSSGRVWTGAVPIDLDAILTATDNLILFCHSSGVWTSSVLTQYNNTQYDNGTNLTALGTNRYAVNWVFRGVEANKHLYIVLGTGDYTLNQAEAASVPALPTQVSSHAVLVAKIVVQNGASTGTITSAFDKAFVSAAATDHNDTTNRDALNAHPLSSITPASSKNGKLLIVDPTTGTSISYTDFLYSQIVQLSAINVSDPTWAEQASRLLMVIKQNGIANFQGAAELIDIILPPATITSLSSDTGWVGESRTITGENFLGEISKLSQIGMGTDGTLFLCTASSQGTSGGANGSATFRRNRSVDALDMSVTNDVNIANLLDPTRTGGNSDDGWDTTNNVKIITTLTCKVGSWFTQGTGYHFFCYQRSGTSYYWRRIGQPQSIQLPINSTTHPNICAALTAHDWGSGWYTQTGLETVYQDQYWADATNQQFYKKVTSTKWKRF